MTGPICDPAAGAGHNDEELLPHADHRGAFHVYRCHICRRVTTKPMPDRYETATTADTWAALLDAHLPVRPGRDNRDWRNWSTSMPGGVE